MVDESEASKANLSPEKEAAQSDFIPPPSILTDMEVVHDDEEEEEEEEEEEYEEEEDESEDDESEEEDEEEKVNNGELHTNEEQNRGKSIVEEETKNESSVVTVKEAEKKSKEPKTGEKSKSKERRDKTTRKTVNGDHKPESSTKRKSSKRVESMGMVFMCSSKTKTDCFRYKVLGLPANKQDQVAKIYKGMRLFLFDVDLRLMYGIFKAAAPGGYNLEPKAFNSEFPSQVRFTVMDDCLPVAEEKFKDILKGNYYTRTKFEGLLKADQVKKLCKLFAATSKGPIRRKLGSKPRRARSRENHRDERRVRSREDEFRDRKKRKIRAREDERRPRHRSRSRSPRREKGRYADYERPPVFYERAAPVVRYLPPPLPVVSPGRSYAYDRDRPPLDVHPYIHDRVPYHDAIRERERARDWERDREVEQDPYYVYSREAPPTTVYALPPDYHIVSREYHHPPVVQPPPPEYRYRDVGPAMPPPEYRPHRTHYRY